MLLTHKTFLRKQTPLTPRKVANSSQANHTKPPKKPSHMPSNGERISWDKLTRPMSHWPMGFVSLSRTRFFSPNDTLLTQAIRPVSSDFSQSYPPWTLFLKIILHCFRSQFIDPLPSPAVNNYHPTHPIVTTTPHDPSLSLIYSYFCIFSHGMCIGIIYVWYPSLCAKFVTSKWMLEL